MKATPLYPSNATMQDLPPAALEPPRLRALAALVLALLATPRIHAQSAPVPAAAAIIHYHIAAGPLNLALRQFAATAGILLSADARLTQGKSSPGLQGDSAVAPGLQQLLVGTGLAAVRQPDGSFILINAPAVPSASRDDAPELPPVVVAADSHGEASYQARPAQRGGRGNAAPLALPQVVNVVSAQQIQDQRPRNLDDALADVSGMTQGNTLGGTQDTIMKRGFGGNRDGSVMRNGMPLVQGRSFNATAEQVEVLKGPSSLLYGLMDPGGVINIVSKTPQLQAHRDITVVGSSYAHDRVGGQTTLDATGPIGEAGLAYRLIIDRSDQNYWRNFGQNQETLVAPSLAWYGRDTQLVWSLELRKFLYPFDRGTAIDPRTGRALAIPAERRMDEPFDVMQGRSATTQLMLDHALDADWKLHLGLSYNREVYDANQLRITGIDPVAGTVTRSNDATHGALSTDSYGIVYLNGHTTWAGLRHDLQVGADLEYRRIYRPDLLRQTVTGSFNYLDPVYGSLSAPTTVSAPDSEQTDLLHDHSLFFQDALHLDAQWTLVAGLRYQGYRQLAGRGRPFNINTDQSGTKLLPRAGLIYALTPQLSLYASYTQSIKPTSSIAPLASGMVIDSSVPPEQARSWEAGIKLDQAQGLSGSAAVFDIRKNNVLVSQLDPVTNITAWRTSGAARARGIELDVSGQLAPRWSLTASYAWLDARTTQDPVFAGLRLWNVARQTAALTVAHDAGAVWGGDRLRLGGGLHYVGERPGDSGNSFMLPAYAVTDAFASYDTTIGGRVVKFQLNIKNVFNKTYYTSSANQYFISLGDARQVSLLSSLEF